MVILGIVQARIGSTRLPGKCLMKVGGIPLVSLVVNRCLRSKLMDKVVIATTDRKEDKAIQGVDIFRWPGPPEDVLGRFYACATHFGADIVVRITADDPLKDPELIDEAIGYMLSKSVEFVSNTLYPPTFPWGLDVEVIRIKTLKWLHENVEDPEYREHVTYYILEHPKEFKTYRFKYKEDLHDWRWSIDTEEDIVRMNELISHFYPVDVGYEEVIEYVKAGGKRTKVHRGGSKP